MNEELIKLEDELDEIKQELSTLRKKGTETTLIEIYLLNIKPKINMAKTTQQPEDIKRAKNEIKYIKDEIEKTKNKELPIKIIWAVTEANEALANDEIEDAKEKYEHLSQLYSNEQDAQLKKLVYPACISIYDELLKKQNKNKKQ